MGIGNPRSKLSMVKLNPYSSLANSLGYNNGQMSVDYGVSVPVAGSLI